MKIYYINLSRKSVVDAYLWEKDEENYENGSRTLDLFPAQIDFSERGRTAEDPYPAKIQFVQSGNWYGPNVSVSSYSSFDLEDLFSEEQNSDFGSLDFNYGETRYEARKQWAEEHVRRQEPEDFQKAFDEFWEEVQDNHLDENWKYYEEMTTEEDTWVENHASFNEETVESALVDEIIDEEKDIIYKIVWEDD